MSKKKNNLMQKIHEQRTRDSQALYQRFKGNVEKWLDWLEDQADKRINKYAGHGIK